VIRRLKTAELSTAAEILARGMRDNPLHIRVFGSDAEHRSRALARFFEPVLRGLFGRGAVYGVFLDETLIGVYAEVPPGRCKPSLREKLTVLPAVCSGNSLATRWQVLQWVGDWSRRDRTEPHWHLGPVAVDSKFQGQGIGGRMLADFCSRMDAENGVAYLETDKSVNVGFYKKFGFNILAEGNVLGIPNWFMSRKPLR
jgi:GNAT superfamily N-acetyltransferase